MHIINIGQCVKINCICKQMTEVVSKHPCSWVSGVQRGRVVAGRRDVLAADHFSVVLCSVETAGAQATHCTLYHEPVVVCTTYNRHHAPCEYP